MNVSAVATYSTVRIDGQEWVVTVDDTGRAHGVASYDSDSKAQAHCNHLNAIALLETMMEPMKCEDALIAARDWSRELYGKPIGDLAASGCFRAMLQAQIDKLKDEK